MCLCAGKDFIMKKFNINNALKLKKEAGTLCELDRLQGDVQKLKERREKAHQIAPKKRTERELDEKISYTTAKINRMCESQKAFCGVLNIFDYDINEIQMHAKSRTISANQILAFFEKLNLPGAKKSYYGTKIKLDLNAQSYPSAYKWTPAATMVYAEFTRSGWTVYDIKREEQNKHPKSRVTYIELPETAKAEFIKFFVERW